MHWKNKQIVKPVIVEAIESKVAVFAVNAKDGSPHDSFAKGLYEYRDSIAEEILERLARDFTIVRRRRPQKTIA